MPNQCQPSIPTTKHTQDSAKTFFKEKNLLPLACHVVNNQALYLCSKSKKSAKASQPMWCGFSYSIVINIVALLSSNFSSSSHLSQSRSLFCKSRTFFRYQVSRCAESPLWGLLQSASCYTVNIATVNIFFFQLWILLQLWICIDLTCSPLAAPTPFPRIPIIPSSNASNRSEPGSFSQLP